MIGSPAVSPAAGLQAPMAGAGFFAPNWQFEFRNRSEYD
jgi:hypothetical protein